MKYLVMCVLLLSGCASLNRIESNLLDIDRRLILIQAIVEQDEECWNVDEKIYRLPKDEGYP